MSKRFQEPLIGIVVPSVRVASWLSKLRGLDRPTTSTIDQFAVVQLAQRTDDRYRDLSNELRQLAVDWLTDNDASEHAIQLARDGGDLDSEEQSRVFGEALPSGLRIQ